MKVERGLVATQVLNLLNTGYLSWRCVALHAGWVEPGTGLCSWTAGVLWRRTPRPAAPVPLRPLLPLVAVCVLQFFVWPSAWAVALGRGLVSP